MFKIFKNYIHGQRGFANQIYENLTINSIINQKYTETLNHMADFRMKSFIQQSSKEREIDVLFKNLRPVNANTLNANIKQLIMKNCGSLKNFQMCYIAIINNIGKFNIFVKFKFLYFY